MNKTLAYGSTAGNTYVFCYVEQGGNRSLLTDNAGTGNYLFDRGYTGHCLSRTGFGKHLDAFKLMNIASPDYEVSGNGSMYCLSRISGNPVLGRFLSPDNYVQSATNPQSYNRYSYALNNPLKYTDPDGGWIHIAIGALVGGIINLATNWDNCQGFWEYAAAFGVGAASGAAAAATGGASLWAQAGVAVGTAALTAGTNNVIAQTNHFKGNVDWGAVGQSSVIGGVSGLGGFGAARGFSSVFKGDIVLGQGFRISGRSIPGQVIKQGLSGFAGGYASGFTAGYLYTGDIGEANKIGWKGGWLGGSIGAGLGAGIAYYNSQKYGYNPLSGKYNIDFKDNSLTHGFTQKHGLPDTPQNRELILSNANNRSNTLYGPDVQGNYWRSTTITIEVEIQIWIRIRGNQITNFGTNPQGGYYYYNPELGKWTRQP